MNKKILNEVSRINNIMGNEPVILEQATAVRLLQKLFSNVDAKSLKRIVKSSDDDIKNIIEKIKKGDDVSDNQMSKLFKVIDFSLMAKKLIENKAFSSAFNNKIDDFIVDVKAGRTNYGTGLQRMYDGIDEMLGNESLELVDAVKVEVKRIVDDGIKPKTQASRAAKGFKEGFKSPNVYRNMIRNVRKFRFPTKNFTQEEYQRLLMWLSTGTSRMPMELINLARKDGLGALVTSLGGEAFKRYLYLTGMLTGLNFIKQLIVDNSSAEAERDPEKFLENVLLVAKETLVFPDLQWVIPALVTWDALVTILGPLFAGTGLSGVLSSISDRIDEMQSEADSMLRRAEQEVMNTTGSSATLEGAKNAAPENVRPYIWKNEQGNVLLRTRNSAGKLVDYKITLENGEYIVDMGTPKKLKDIK